MITLHVVVETAKATHYRAEQFGTAEAADRRRRFLKSIEPLGSSNDYAICPTADGRPARMRYYV